MQRSFYTQQTFAHSKLLHKEAVTRRCWVTQDPNVRALFKDWFANQTCHHCLWKGLVQTQSALALDVHVDSVDSKDASCRSCPWHHESVEPSAGVIWSFSPLEQLLGGPASPATLPEKTQCFALRLPPQHKSHATDTISLSHQSPHP